MAIPATETPRALVSVDGACTTLGCGRTHLYRLMREGKLQAVKLGSRTMVPREALDALIASLPAARPRAAA